MEITTNDEYGFCVFDAFAESLTLLGVEGKFFYLRQLVTRGGLYLGSNLTTHDNELSYDNYE